MADYATLKAAIQAVIYENGNQEITGSVMQATLLAMVNSLGANYQYAGIATPSTNPGTPDQNVFYLASTAGTYVNFGNIVLAEGEVAVLKYNGSWTKDTSGLASAEKVSQLDQKVDENIIGNKVLDNPGHPSGSMNFAPLRGQKYFLAFTVSRVSIFTITLRAAPGASGTNLQTIAAQTRYEPGDYVIPFICTVDNVKYLRMGESGNWPTLSSIEIYNTLKTAVFDTLLSKDQYTTLLENKYSGQYYNSSANLASTASWDAYKEDVSAYIGKPYRLITFCPGGSSYASAHTMFVDSENNILDDVRSVNNVIEGTVPQGAKYLLISNRREQCPSPTLWIEQTGIRLATTEYVDRRIGENKNNLKGQKISFIGDSITEGYGVSAQYRYCNIFCNKYGAVLNNLGVSSTCIANNTLDSMGPSRFVTRATQANLSGSKLIVIFGGTNDFSYDSKAIGDLFAEETITASQYIGNKKKVAVTDTDSFAGALHDLIATIRTNCPNVPIVFITPLKRGRYDTGRPTSKETNQWGDYLDDFCNAIKEICGYYSIPVLDANSISELDFSNSSIASLYSQDSLHPNSAGHAIIAELLYRFVENNIVIL